MTAQIFMRTPARARTATPLLAFIAGEFADAVAQVWPAPHAEFFALPAARRHAAAIALAGLAQRQIGPAELRRLVEYQRDAVVAETLAGEHAQGLMRALTKAGETLWRVDDYGVFLHLLAEPMANEVLRHLDLVRPAYFDPIANLPPALRCAAIVRAVPTSAAASDLGRAFQLATRMRRPYDAGRIARRWAAGGDTRAVFTRAVEDLTPDAFRTADAAPVLGAPFTRVTSRKQLEALALEFQNCLADHTVRIADGRMAVYAWRADTAAAIALSWDAAGWRLAEAKARQNVDLEEAQLRDLATRVKAAGVRIGPSVQTLITRLDDWANNTSYCYPIGPSFIEQLMLGDLWS
ncbi:MAG TPA: hypothetical protein PLN33_00235 [Hyphomonadaceae bacterium]|nr:hypothetical protein [Hyphomonadaceae bacterium]HPN04798.1 hypothetical protein [Hyphomonadaceae bacterium]